MSKIFKIDGRDYAVSLPTGGLSETDKENEFDQALKAGCQLDLSKSSWCWEALEDGTQLLRGISDLDRGSAPVKTASPTIGFRPVLVPLVDDAPVFDDTVYAGKDGKTVKLGSLRVKDGDITIENTKKGTPIEWGVFGGKLIALTNLVDGVTYEELARMGYGSYNPDEKIDETMLAGGYILLTTYATLSAEEYEETQDWDETPTAHVAIKLEYLLNRLKEMKYFDLSDFLYNYTYDDLVFFAAQAMLDHAVAFEYRPSLDEKFSFPETCEKNAMYALLDFVSGHLQENGFEAASKYMDSWLEL